MTCSPVHEQFVSIFFLIAIWGFYLFILFCKDGLAASGNAPRIFLKTLPNGLPIVAVLFNSCFALLSYMGVHKGSGLVFTYFSQLAAIAGLLTWFGIAVTYLRFYKGMKVQGMDRTKLPYYSKFQPFAAWYAVCSIFFILLVSHFLHIYKKYYNLDQFILC